MKQRILRFFLSALIVCLPFSTTWIYRELVVNGGKWQYGTLQFLLTEFLLFGALCVALWIFFTNIQKRRPKFSQLGTQLFFLV
jgi:hypothetical protein